MTTPITYIEDWINPPVDKTWFDALQRQLDWQRRDTTPRSEYWTNLFERPYTYGSGRGVRTYEHQPDHEIIAIVRDKLVRTRGIMLEGCFLNMYLDGSDSLGYHADDDPGIDHNKPIAVVTLGQPREIAFHEVLVKRSEGVKGVYGPEERLLLGSGSLLLMHAGMQFTHEHRIPRAAFKAGPRISMTYRGLIPMPET